MTHEMYFSSRYVDLVARAHPPARARELRYLAAWYSLAPLRCKYRYEEPVSRHSCASCPCHVHLPLTQHTAHVPPVQCPNSLTVSRAPISHAALSHSARSSALHLLAQEGSAAVVPVAPAAAGVHDKRALELLERHALDVDRAWPDEHLCAGRGRDRWGRGAMARSVAARGRECARGAHRVEEPFATAAAGAATARGADVQLNGVAPRHQ